MSAARVLQAWRRWDQARELTDQLMVDLDQAVAEYLDGDPELTVVQLAKRMGVNRDEVYRRARRHWRTGAIMRRLLLAITVILAVRALFIWADTGSVGQLGPAALAVAAYVLLQRGSQR